MKNSIKLFIVLSTIVLLCACNSLPETSGRLNSNEIVKTVKTVKPWRWRIKEVKINVKPDFWGGDSSGIYIYIEDSFKTFQRKGREEGKLYKYNPNIHLWFCPANWEGGVRMPTVQAIYPARYLGKNDKYKIFIVSLSETTWPNWREDLIKFYNLDTKIPKDIVIIENSMTQKR